MIGIAERAANLRDLVGLTLQRDKLMNQARALDGRVGQLQSWGQSLRALIPAARALNAAGTPSSALDDLRSLGRTAARARQDFLKNPQSVRQPEFDAANIFWGQASKTIGVAEATIRAEWRDHVNGLMPAYQSAVVRALAGHEAVSIETTLAELARKAAAIAARPPASDDDAGEVVLIAQAIASLLQRFDVMAMPAEVRVFIMAALADDATIDLLTPEVREWLVDRGIDRNVRLSFASTP